jgi:MFS family permease
MQTPLSSHRPFVKFWIAQTASGFGYQMLTLALGWQLYDLTGSAMDLGLVGLAQFVPAFALALVVGQVADRGDRRRIVFICAAINAVIAAVMVAGSLQHWLGREVIFACVFVLGATRGFESPTMQALLPIVVDKELLPRALASSSASRQAAALAGPALAGFIYLAGPATVYALSAVFFFAASLLVLSVHVPKAPPTREPLTLQSVFGGLTYIWGKPVVLGAISLDLFAVLLGGATALLPIYAKDILGTGSWGLGLLRSAPAIGALSTAAWLAHHPIQSGVGKKLFVSVAAFGAFTVGFGLSTSLPLSMLMLALLGATDMVSQVIRHSLVQLETPNEMRGRVSAINSIFIGTSNQLGQFESGLTAAWWGAVPAVVVGGIGTVAVAALWMKLFPELRRRQVLNSKQD